VTQFAHTGELAATPVRRLAATPVRRLAATPPPRHPGAKTRRQPLRTCPDRAAPSRSRPTAAPSRLAPSALAPSRARARPRRPAGSRLARSRPAALAPSALAPSRMRTVTLRGHLPPVPGKFVQNLDKAGRPRPECPLSRLCAKSSSGRAPTATADDSAGARQPTLEAEQPERGRGGPATAHGVPVEGDPPADAGP
jgi:hypothetical protein